MSLMPWLKDINQDLFKKYLEVGNIDFIKSHYLDYLDSIKFEATFKNHKELIKEKNYKQVKCAFITNFNLDFIYPSLFCSGIRSGIFFEIYKSEFNTSIQDALAENTELSKFNPSYLIIYVNLDFFDPKFPCNLKNQNDLEVLFSIAMKYSRLGTKIIFANLTENSSSNFGDYDLLNDNSIRFNVRELNNRVYKFCKDNNFLLFDTNYLSSSIGSKEFFSLKNQLISKSPYNFDYIPLLTDKLSKIISSSLGLQKKCLVLDLDNTLWGGVIGDDGMSGIELGNNSAIGEAYLMLQKYILQLKNQGVILAVCSKNNHDVAIDVFRNHPEMIIKETDIAHFMINWNDKASNIVNIANTLEIGLNSIVFLDDNPVEREIVREHLPDVFVIEVDNDPLSLFVNLSQSSCFEQVNFTNDDLNRNQDYQNKRKRNELLEVSVDYVSFLKNLKMNIIISNFQEIDATRISQLVLRSNQFNLTTKRYSLNQILSLMEDKNFITLQARLSDKFGDNGLISLIIIEKKDNSFFIDTWIMSCRVLKRDVEHCMMNAIVKLAKSFSVSQVYGEYIATKKNNLVKDHYKTLNFKTNPIDGKDIWVLDVDQYKEFDLSFYNDIVLNVN